VSVLRANDYDTDRLNLTGNAGGGIMIGELTNTLSRRVFFSPLSRGERPGRGGWG
jgi:hypothetical protein